MSGKKLLVDYWGRGSLVEADDINYLKDQFDQLKDKTKKASFTSFKIEDQKTEYTVGEFFPTSDVPVKKTFTWKIDNPNSIKPNSIKIEELTTQTVLANNLENTGSFELEFVNSIRYSKQNQLVYQISAKTLSDEIISEKFIIHFYDLIFYGNSLTKQNLNNVNKKSQKIISDSLEITCVPTTDNYKFFALPEGYEIDSVIDDETSLQFVLSSDKIQSEIVNEFGLSVNYNLFFSVYPIESGVKLRIKLKG